MHLQQLSSPLLPQPSPERQPEILPEHQLELWRLLWLSPPLLRLASVAPALLSLLLALASADLLVASLVPALRGVLSPVASDAAVRQPVFPEVLQPVVALVSRVAPLHVCCSTAVAAGDCTVEQLHLGRP